MSKELSLTAGGLPPKAKLRGYFPGWLTVAALTLLAGLALSALLFTSQRAASRAATEVVYGQSMWAMHSRMHSLENGMPDSGGMMTADLNLAPAAELAERFYDFGAISGSQEVSRSFILANLGGAPLIISSAYTTCSCARAEISAAVIPPGKAGMITVYFHPQMAMGGSAVRRGIILETNDPQQPLIELWVQADLIKIK